MLRRTVGLAGLGSGPIGARRTSRGRSAPRLVRPGAVTGTDRGRRDHELARAAVAARPQPAHDHRRDTRRPLPRTRSAARRSRRRRRPARCEGRSPRGRSSRAGRASGARPATPIATSVVPRRNGRPNESVTITATSFPACRRIEARIRRALSSGSTGSRTTVPGSAAFDGSTPADAQTKPWRVSAITSAPRERTTRFVSRRITSTLRGSLTSPASSRARAGRLDVVETHDAALRLRDRLLRDHDDVAVLERAAPAISAPRSSPASISGRPSTGMDRDHATECR